MKLLERGSVDYDTFVYSHSTYGRGDRQHALIDGLLEHCAPERMHRGWVLDDAIDSPANVVHSDLRIKRMIAAETVSSYWTALPVVLEHGHTEVALGITRSTDEHNLVWDANGERINYLWGMSSAAEQLLHDYLRSELVANVSMFHILRPVYDVSVFTLLDRDLHAVPSTHSCARVKPWCGRCAKCIYVWMSYAAWLPEPTIAETFEIAPLDVTENRILLRKMLGLESYKPTDCVGTVSEARLAYAMCRARGVGGVLVDEIGDAFRNELSGILERYTILTAPGPMFLARLAAVIESQFEVIAGDAVRRAGEILRI